MPAGMPDDKIRALYEDTIAPLARSVDLVHMGDCRPLLLSGQPLVITVHDLFFLDVPDSLPPLEVDDQRRRGLVRTLAL